MEDLVTPDISFDGFLNTQDQNEQEPKFTQSQFKEVCKISKIIYDQYEKSSELFLQLTQTNEDLQNENIEIHGEQEQLEELTLSL